MDFETILRGITYFDIPSLSVGLQKLGEDDTLSLRHIAQTYDPSTGYNIINHVIVYQTRTKKGTLVYHELKKKFGPLYMYVDRYGRTLLHAAASVRRLEHLELFKEIANTHVDLAKRADLRGGGFFHEAIRQGRAENIYKILDLCPHLQPYLESRTLARQASIWHFVAQYGTSNDLLRLIQTHPSEHFRSDYDAYNHTPIDRIIQRSNLADTAPFFAALTPNGSRLQPIVDQLIKALFNYDTFAIDNLLSPYDNKTRYQLFEMPSSYMVQGEAPSVILLSRHANVGHSWVTDLRAHRCLVKILIYGPDLKLIVHKLRRSHSRFHRTPVHGRRFDYSDFVVDINSISPETIDIAMQQQLILSGARALGNRQTGIREIYGNQPIRHPTFS